MCCSDPAIFNTEMLTLTKVRTSIINQIPFTYFCDQDIVVYVSTEAQMLNTSKLMLHAYFLHVPLQGDLILHIF